MTSGRHFLQIPGPTNVPERVLRAMDRPVPDHRGPEMPSLVAEIRAGLRGIFKSEQAEPVIFPGSGTGAWEASLVNTLSPGERVLTFQNGHFARLYAEAARQLGMKVDEVKLRWGDAVTQEDVEGNLMPEHRAVLIVHNETSTGVTTDVGAVRRGIDRSGHDPLLLVDVVSSLGSIDFRMDEWRVDVALTGTQKGLMLPPGGAILCVGPRALAAAETSRTPRYFYDWRPVIRDMQQGFFPYTPATLLLFGLREALRMLFEQGLEQAGEVSTAVRYVALTIVGLCWAWAIITLGVFMASMLQAQQSGCRASHWRGVGTDGAVLFVDASGRASALPHSPDPNHFTLLGR